MDFLERISALPCGRNRRRRRRTQCNSAFFIFKIEQYRPANHSAQAQAVDIAARLCRQYRRL